jgi:hypothetical protein
MAEIKISQLPTQTDITADASIPIVQGGSTQRITFGDFLENVRTDALSSYALTAALAGYVANASLTSTLAQYTLSSTLVNYTTKGPAFSAYPNSSIQQTITANGLQQKVLFQNEEFDTDGCFSSSRFTPTVAGYYQINANVRMDNMGSSEAMVVLWKNGAEYKRGYNATGGSITSYFAMQVSTLVYANGTSDYFEVYVQNSSGANRDVTVAGNISFGNITWFNGSMVRGT